MSLTKKWAARMRFGGGTFFVGLAMLVIGALILREPMAVYAVTNPGLDSGNAQVTTVGSDTVLSYKTPGPSSFKAPAGVTNVRVLVVGGGGGGGAGESTSAGDAGGGGGAGEYRYETSQTVTPGQTVTVTVGGGGNGSTTPQANGGTTAQNGASGSNSVFGSLTARGGGGGGGNDQAGINGGSGGGAGGHCTNSSTLTAGGTKTAVSPGVGNNGGSSPAGSCTPRGASGGGGAGAVGTNGSGNNGGVGAIGLSNDITGTSTFYAAGGGGGGGASSGTGANGGSSIGGRGGNAGGGNGVVGTANTGSGGGGGGSGSGTSNGFGGNGGSGVVIVRFTTQNINAPSPGGVTGLTMWYKADGTGNTNGEWKDSSGFGYNLTQGTASKQPALTANSLNFNPAYVFDGTDDVFSLAGHGVGGNQPLSGFFAALSNSNTGGYRYFNEFGDDSPSFSIYNGKPDMDARVTSPVAFRYSADAAFNPHVFSYISPNANNQSRIIGVDDQEESQNVTSGTYVTSSGGFAGNSFGRTNGSAGTSWSGPIGEAMYFNKVLTPAERLKIISYLSIKYGVTRYQGASGAGYSDSDGTTIWPADATFKNNIAGIGRDDASALSQKQSKSSATGSAADIVTIGHVAIAANNQANPNNFGVDKAFLLWGHNGASTNTTSTVTGGYVRMDRIWKTVRTTSMGAIKVRIPKSIAPGANGVMYVSTSTTFNASTQRIDMVDLGTEYEATVASLPAATSYFSFGSLIGADLEMVSKKAYVPGTNTELTTYTPGQPIDYKVVIKNNGPDAAGTVTFTDTLPAGIVPTQGGSSGNGWNCSVAGQNVTCTRSSMASGSTEYVITTEATIASNVTGSMQNTASVSSASTDPNPSNNSKSLTLSAAPKADLGVTKVHQGAPTAGGQYHYNFTVTNNGPSDATGFQVTDTLPDAKLTFDRVEGNPNVSCIGQGTSSFTCTFSGATLANNGNATFQAYINVAGDYVGGPVTNTGTVAVTGGATDPNPSNNTSSPDTTNVIVETQLSIAKEPNAGPTANFVAGENNVYKINVTSQGASQSPVNTITVTDTLSEDYSFVSANGTNWTCNHSDGTVTCTYGATLAAGNTTSDILLTVAVDPIAKGTIPNTAEVSSTTPDPDLTDNTSTHNTIVDSEVDLALAKGHVGTTFVAGQQEQYAFSVTNAGPSADSPSYTITDTLPTGVTFVSTEPGSAANCVGASGNTVVNCTGGAIGAGDPAQVTTINVAVGGSVTGTIDNSATVTVAAGTTDTDLTNNTGDDNGLQVEPNADLSISKTPATDVTAGSNATYTIQVSNAGPSDVAGFTVTDTLDPNLTYVSSTGNICTPTGTSPQNGQILTCTDSTGVASGNNTSFNITVTVNASATPSSTITNSASVAPPNDVNDPTPGNNSTSVNRGVLASADLQITKSHTGDFTAGTNNNNFTIVVTNAGPSDAGPFTVTDVLPAGMTYVNAASTAGIGVSCTNAGQTVTCIGNPGIGAGQTSTITLTVAVDGDIAGNTVINNTASVNSGTPDPNNTNNTSPADAVTIDSSADLEIEKTNMTDFTAGTDEDYNVEVINYGPSDVSGFTVTDTLPAELTFVSSGSSSECSAVGQDVTCDGGALASGASTNFTIRVHTDSGLTAGTVVNNTAEVATIAPTTDPNNGNNSSTDSTNVVNVTDLSIQKNSTGSYVAGATGQFTFTVNNAGPSTTPAGDVQVTDSLPGGMTFASGSGTNWSCAGSSGQSVVCTYAPTLAVGATTPLLTVTVNIASDMQGQVQNTGSVISTFDDSDPADDTSTVTVNVGSEADLTATKVRQGSGVLVAGQNITYRFTVENDGGPSQANNVTITDNLQGDFTYQSFASVSGGTWDCTESGGTVTCTLPSLDVNDTAVVDVTLKIAEDAPNPLANTAAVTFNGTDPSPANPTASDPLTYSADLEVDISHEQKAYRGGDTIDYTITAINHGPSAAEDAVLTVTIPEGLTIEHVSAEKPGGGSILSAIDRFFFPRALAATNPFSCSLSGNKLICNASTMFVGSYPLYVTGKIGNNFTGQIVLAAHITSSTPDPNLSDTSASDTIFDVLAATGQNIWLWIGGAGIMLVLGSLIALYLRRRNRTMLV